MMYNPCEECKLLKCEDCAMNYKKSISDRLRLLLADFPISEWVKNQIIEEINK